MSKKSNNFWAAVESRIEAGQVPEIFINPAGRVCLNNGHNGAEFPARLLAKLPAAVIEAANAKAAERAAADDAKFVAWAAECRANRAALDARADGLGFL